MAGGQRWVRRAALTALALTGLGWAVMVAALSWRQEALLFQPEPLPPDHRFELGDDVSERWIAVPGARLHALHLRVPKPRGLVFFLHGNSGNVATWLGNADFYRQAQVDLFMLDYRGYGKSSGRIESEAQLQADVRAAWDAVAPAYAALPQVIFGRSLGTALAAGLAAQVQPALTVLVSPYESMARLAREHYPWVPPAALRYPLRTVDAVARLQRPVWLVHGEIDPLIDPAHSRAIQAAAPSAQLLIVPGAAHNDLQNFEPYLAHLRRLLAGL